MQVARLEFLQPDGRWTGPYSAEWMTLHGFSLRYSMLPSHLELRPAPDPRIYLDNPGVDRYVTACPSANALEHWFGEFLQPLLTEGGHIALYEVPLDAIAHDDGQQVVFQQRRGRLVSRSGSPVPQAELIHRVHKSMDEVPNTMTYTPPLHYERTAAERLDNKLSWNRSDIAFFASGACHILAWAFIEQRPDGHDFELVYMRPDDRTSRGHHVYATNGEWAFDYFGWTREDEMLNASTETYRSLMPEWSFERVVIANRNLDMFCQKHQHRLPQQFAQSPWARANAYLSRFSKEPPI